MVSRRFTNYPEPRYVKTAEHSTTADVANELNKKLTYEDIFPTFDFTDYPLNDYEPVLVDGLFEFISELQNNEIIVVTGLKIEETSSHLVSPEFNCIMYYHYGDAGSWTYGECLLFDVRDLYGGVSDGAILLTKTDDGMTAQYTQI